MRLQSIAVGTKLARRGTAALGVFVLLAAAAARGEGRLIERVESAYNSIFIEEDAGYISMTFGHNRRFFTESRYNPKNPLELPVAYTRNMTVGVAYVPGLASILEIGFGGGRTSWYLHRHLPQVSVTAVELDPEVARLATQYFGVREEPNFGLVVADGRSYLMTAKPSYDLILIDAYRGPFVPFHLLTREFYQLAKRHLRPGGAVVQNVEPTTMLFDAAAATIGSVFEAVDYFPSAGNVVMVAYDGPTRPTEALLKLAGARQALHHFLYDLDELVRQRRFPEERPTAKPLTDDFAPVETLQAIERHNRKWK